MVCHAVFFKYCAGKMCQAKVVNMLCTHSGLEFPPSATEYIFSHSSTFNVDIKATHLKTSLKKSRFLQIAIFFRQRKVLLVVYFQIRN